jgi:hypothetical protein
MQVATHASVRNVITSMRLLSAADWAVFFESVSLVHEALCEGTRVSEMDFATRDRYRHAGGRALPGHRLRRARSGAARSPHGGARRSRCCRIRERRRLAGGRPRLLPHFPGTTPARGRARLPPSRAAMASESLVRGGHAPVPRLDRALDGGDPCGSPRAHGGGRGFHAVAPPARAPRGCARLGSRDRSRATFRDTARRAPPPAQARAHGGRPRGRAHAGRHPDAPDRRDRNPGGGPSARSALPGQPRRGAAIRAPLRLVRRSGGKPARG